MERSRIGSGGAYSSTTGYSRRPQPGDAKSNDRHRLMTDRAAYIAFLEAQAERANAIALEAEEVGVGIHSIRARMDELEEKMRSTTQAVELVKDHGARAGESARAGRLEMEDQLRVIEGRVQRLEHAVGDSRATTEAEMSRLRNEVALAVQDLGQRVDERLQALRAWRLEADEGTASVIREAQATCVRLADDALGAVEASQRKLEELSRRTDAGLEVIRVDITGLKAELAGVAKHGGSGAGASSSSAHSLGFAAVSSARNGGDDTAQAIADTVERRLAARLGQQVLQLSEVLRRVVQAQATLHQQWSGTPSAVVTEPARFDAESRIGNLATDSSTLGSNMAHASNVPSQTAPLLQATSTQQHSTASAQPLPAANGIASPFANLAGQSGMASGDAQRRNAIDDLYAELKRLEEYDGAMRRSPSANSSHARRPRSSRAARSVP